MLPAGRSYAEIVEKFRWRIPRNYNIGVDVCDKWADGSEKLALIHLAADGGVERISFDELKRRTNRLANVFRAHGIGRGDRIGILLAQSPETAIAHIAAYKLGAIAVPLFTLFGADALLFRLRNSAASALVTDGEGLAKIAPLRPDLPDLRLVLSVDGARARVLGLGAEMARAADHFDPVLTTPDDPAVIVYTSGTTGPPKGALHGHRVLLGHLPGVEMPQDLFPQPGDLFWTPADWAWVGGLFDVLLPSLHHGIPVLARRLPKFDPEEAFALMARFSVRNVFLPPTALKMLRAVPHPRARFDYALRSIGSGGETLGAELLAWGNETFGVTINEFYGQTECNLVVANCATIMEVRPGAMGRAVPGHEVRVLDAAGAALPAGSPGIIAVRRPDPVMFLGYWNDAEASARKFIGPWMLTGDQGMCDEDGYFHFVGRDDDVITSSGYRIGPGEIEDCLLKHPAVALAGVVGVPDALRTERVKAFIVLAEGFLQSDALAREIQDFVRTQLAAHEYPREIAFIAALPMTTTGKIMRRELRRQGQVAEASGQMDPSRP